jgi:hypothetical protein
MTYSAINIQRRGHGVALEAAASKFTMQTKTNEKNKPFTMKRTQEI